MIERRKSRLKVSRLCQIAGVSRSGYYGYVRSLVILSEREEQDRRDFERILEAYRYRNRHKGAKELYMMLAGHFGILMNLKKIRRLMKKYGLFCPIRKANPYRRMIRAIQTNSIHDNLLNRDFKQKIPRKVFLTDITYLYYPHGEKAFLSTIFDAATHEIVSHKTSRTIDLPFVLDSVHILCDVTNEEFAEGAMIHSDQGCHYTSSRFQNLVKEKNLLQSMSRRGNCWDNAPQESFFGHMKDELHLEKCHDFESVVAEVDDFIDYYNYDRYQWGLAKMTPVEYREFLLTGMSRKEQNRTKRKDDRLDRQSSKKQ
jgi:transposase InsO family protein